MMDRTTNGLSIHHEMVPVDEWWTDKYYLSTAAIKQSKSLYNGGPVEK